MVYEHSSLIQKLNSTPSYMVLNLTNLVFLIYIYIYLLFWGIGYGSATANKVVEK